MKTGRNYFNVRNIIKQSMDWSADFSWSGAVVDAPFADRL
jgi:hypothetical protein